jgi:hypothetical protein
MLSKYYNKISINNLDINEDYGYFCELENINQKQQTVLLLEPPAKEPVKSRENHVLNTYPINVNYYMLKQNKKDESAKPFQLFTILKKTNSILIHKLLYVLDFIYTGSFKKLYRRFSGL